MQAIILTDTEAETTVELEESMVNQASHGTTNATKSIFHLTLDDGLENHESLDIKSHEARLKEEIKQWSTLWRDSMKQLKAFKLKPHPVIDTTILSAEKRAYLEKAPDLQRFLRNSVEFRQKAYIFLEDDCEKFQTDLTNLIEVCEYKTILKRERKIDENLAYI
ncbi:PREDICTED: uncharacterized protein LOC108371871 [Rhagoletis zephyria]|uniref:uncharacterized protein LOC108371871 n=1 Tax=Rhagoletis zephyria TaxID=28612 RepID=UPI000811A6B9|nr:PREDICTED: uncharacterized protein LOC108371871 [Rhagoletis zephyria]